MAKPASPIITGNLDAEFRRARQKPRTNIIVNEANVDGNIPPHLVQAMKRRAQAGTSIDRVGQFRYNPFLQATNLDIPSDIKIRHQYMRYFVKTNALVGAAVELHAEFPLSGFHVEHEDPAIQEFLEDMIEETDLVDHVLMAAQEWWTVGEWFTFGFFDDPQAPSCWSGFLLLDPDKLIVQTSPWIRGPKKEKTSLVVDNLTQKIVEQGPNHPITGSIYRELPPDIIMAAKARRPLELSPLQVSHVKRGSPFAIRGESILERVFPLLMYKDKLRSAQYSIADRHISPTEVWKVGETGDPADNEELQAFQELLASQYNDTNRSIIWHHALQYQVEGANGKIMPIWQEMEPLDNEILAGLLLNKSLIMGDSSTFASDVVRYDILINRYLIFRKRVEKWLLRSIFAPILKIHEMYVPEFKVKSRQYRQMAGKGRPLAFPTIKWEKQNLRDDAARTQLLIELAAKQLVPMSTVYPLLNLDPRQINERIDEEIEENMIRKKKLAERLAKQGITMPLNPEEPPSFGGSTTLPDSIGGGGGASAIGLPGTPGGLGEAANANGSLPGGAGGGLPTVVPGTEGGPSAGLAGGLPGAPTESSLPIGIPTE